MKPITPQTHTIALDQAGFTLARVLRALLPTCSWSQVRRLIEGRQVKIGSELCLDEARRVRLGDQIELLARPERQNADHQLVHIRYLDEQLVVVEKPSGLNSVRHPTEREWTSQRKSLSPTLEDLVPVQLARMEPRLSKGPAPRLRVVHRLDKETSGLLVFARTVHAERQLGKQFHRHTVIRRYLAMVPGRMASQTIRSFILRDRGDGRRGSTKIEGTGKEAITHIEVAEQLEHYTLLHCRLETGRTHQIRIHLAEAGHPVCGEKVYFRNPQGHIIHADQSNAPRLALHAAELGFHHPTSGESLHWTMPLPADLDQWLTGLRASSPRR